MSSFEIHEVDFDNFVIQNIQIPITASNITGTRTVLRTWWRLLISLVMTSSLSSDVGQSITISRLRWRLEFSSISSVRLFWENLYVLILWQVMDANLRNFKFEINLISYIVASSMLSILILDRCHLIKYLVVFFVKRFF